MDHYPHTDSIPDDDYAALCRDITAALNQINVPPPVGAPQPTANRFVLRYGVYTCRDCGLAKEFCRGHGPPDAQSQDAARADASLAQRIRDCRGGK